MTDERDALVPSDGNERIDIKDAWQVLWWCRSLNITKSQLEAAIEAVGNEPEDIKRYFTAALKKKP